MIWFKASRALTLAAALVGLAALPAASNGTPRSWVVDPGGVAIGVHLDLVAALLITFVGIIGWVVATYSMTNFRGRAHHDRAGAALFLALVALLATVSGGSLVSIALGWTLSGLAVASLVARAGGPDAAAAARLLRRYLLIGDAFLWSGVVVAALTFPSLERSRLHELDAGWSTTLVALLLLGAAVVRTGLVPAHRWLPETAEAPSPVSALLHAGVVNGAGVLVLLTWPLYAAAPAALLVLVILGAASVVVGVLAGRVRSDVKGRLACSTTSQMGYMSLQLGLGLPAAALMHLIGHGAYKSWLFLRAGGAVGRAKALVVPETVRSAHHAASAALAVAVAGLVAAPALMILIDTTGVAAVVPMLLALLAAATAGRAVAGLSRVALGVQWGVSTAGGVLAGGYIWSVLGSDKLLAVALPVEAVWGPLVGSILLVATVLAALLIVRGDRHLTARPDSALAMVLLRTALTPGPGARGWQANPLAATAVTDPGAGFCDNELRVKAVVLAAALVGPAWPLRNLVAANTLAHLETVSFDVALAASAKAHGVSGRPSLDYFLDQHDAGRITQEHLNAALTESGDQPALADFVEITRALAFMATPSLLAARPVLRRCETLPPGHCETVTRMVDEHTALWAQRSWSSAAAAHDPGPWTRWRAAAAQSSYDRALRLPGAAAVVATLPEDPAAAIGVLAESMDLQLDRLTGYLIATFVSAPGWSGHAAWRARRAGDPGPLVEWAALRMAHDVLLSGAVGPELPLQNDEPTSASAWEQADPALVDAHAKVWQRALEIGVEDWLLPEVADRERSRSSGHPSPEDAPISQSLWCIDVRSEPVRRHLEAQGAHRTFGYAGFFGAAVDHLDPDSITHERCPALISPSFTARENVSPLRLSQVLHRTVTSVSRSPLGALVVAEAGGGLAAVSSLAATLQPRLLRRISSWWTRGASGSVRPELHTDLSLKTRVAMAAAALRSTGLTRDFAPLLVVCAHGGSPENNAFATAYDCGACGGNDGLVNATLLVDALNDGAVRAELAEQGLVLPDATRAVAALHDTTTDTVTLLPEFDLSPSADLALQRLAAALLDAGRAAASERAALLPQNRPARHQSSSRRAADWSEPTPEWGLAGNAAIVIGPRSLTEGVDLQGRVFLHSYDRDTDPEAVVLEQLLTAPLVVTQWINSQYYFSAVAPEVFGSGDKTTHNVVGDVGVLRGAHGDLQTGLPWQALFRSEPGSRPDAESLVHEPVRLLAVVVADPAMVRTIVGRHEGLRNLVSHEWIRLVCVDRGESMRLRPDLTWETSRRMSKQEKATGPEESQAVGVRVAATLGE